jgi:hypothetical protein
MTHQEALAILDHATGAALLNRKDHVDVQQALMLMKDVVVEHATLKQAVNETVEATKTGKGTKPKA